MHAHLRRSAARLRSTRGATMVEFAIVLPILLLMIFSIFEFGRLFFTQLTMQHAVREAVRLAITDTRLDDEDGEPLSRVESIRQQVVEQAISLDVDVDRIDVLPADGGGPSEIVTVTAGFAYTFVVPIVAVFVPGGVYDFTVRTSMKNEPFLTN